MSQTNVLKYMLHIMFEVEQEESWSLNLFLCLSDMLGGLCKYEFTHFL